MVNWSMHYYFTTARTTRLWNNTYPWSGSTAPCSQGCSDTIFSSSSSSYDRCHRSHTLYPDKPRDLGNM